MAARMHLTSAAEKDIDEAYAWYEKQRSGLGDDFLTRVEACLRQIDRWPKLFPSVDEHCRRALVRRFPYAIYFEPTEEQTIVHCMIHTARDSKTWRDRLP